MSGVLHVDSYLGLLLIPAALSLGLETRAKGRCHWEWEAGAICRGTGHTLAECGGSADFGHSLVG